jgi:IS605 OrfB family transposase
MPTTKEAAELLSIKVAGVRKLIDGGVLVAVKTGRGFIIDQISLDTYSALKNIQADELENIPKIEPQEVPKNTPEVKQKKQRALPEKHNCSLYTLENNPHSVSLLADFGITRFWDEHAKNVLDVLPRVVEHEHETMHILNSTHMQLESPLRADFSNKRFLLEPTLEYAIPKPTITKTKTKPAVVSKKHKIMVALKIRKMWIEWIHLANEIYNYTAVYLAQNTDAKFLKKTKLRDIIIKNFTTRIDDVCAPTEVGEYAVFEAQLATKQGKKVAARTFDAYSHAITVRSRSFVQGFIYSQKTKQYLQKKYMPKEPEVPENETEAAARIRLRRWKKSQHEFIRKFNVEFEKMTIKNLPELAEEKYCKLIYKTRLDKWFLDVPTDIRKTETEWEKVVAIDPGIRTFLTCYSSSGVFNIGNNVDLELEALQRAADSINAKIGICRNKHRRKSLTRALCRVNNKIKNKIDNLHWNSIKLLSRFDTIILPKFGVKHLSEKLHKKTNRGMFALSHFRFKMRLAQKTSQYGNKVIICNEAYTSKTCGNCGMLNEKLGGKKYFKCPSCNFGIGRDINGARNILARVLSFGDALL